MQIPFVKLEIFDPEEGAWGMGIAGLRYLNIFLLA
jgi:hypothetical protein